MNSDYSRIKDLFAEASNIRDPGLRQSFLDQACADDVKLRKRLEALLFFP